MTKTKEELKEYNKNYYLKNKKKINENHKIYRENNKEYFRQYNKINRCFIYLTTEFCGRDN